MERNYELHFVGDSSVGLQPETYSVNVSIPKEPRWEDMVDEMSKRKFQLELDIGIKKLLTDMAEWFNCESKAIVGTEEKVDQEIEDMENACPECGEEIGHEMDCGTCRQYVNDMKIEYEIDRANGK
jgi:predicted RNA-binding Zn-ribbon protein involved in translation (DUF1610 family)